jgi:hypothetical protein
MQKKLPLRSKLPLNTSKNIDDPKLKEFIEAAESPTRSGTISIENNKLEKKGTSSFVLPWEKENVRKDVSKVFNLRLPEAYYLKLKYLSEKEKESHHKILMGIICPEIDRKIKEIISKLV